MTEQWKPVVGYGNYEISSLGRVRRRGKYLSLFLVKGYLAFNVSLARTMRKSLRVHREVARAFLPGGEGLVRHLNGDRMDNQLENLAWGTYEDNEADKARHGRTLKGEHHHQHKLTAAQVVQIRTSTERGTVLAVLHGVTPSRICALRKGKGWRCIA